MCAALTRLFIDILQRGQKKGWRLKLCLVVCESHAGSCFWVDPPSFFFVSLRALRGEGSGSTRKSLISKKVSDISDGFLGNPQGETARKAGLS
jgi:hypothetical protein